MTKLTGHEPLEELLRFIESGQGVYLSASAMSTILSTVASHKLCAEVVQRIADVLECESVEYEEAKSGVIAQTLFELSSPEIHGTMTPERCAELAAGLAAPTPDLPP